ncbi:MAG: glycerophosphodiester phosphodiesterase family protein [Flavobacteriaceae bacterium]|nr:glycerophosphodiester phosphodiesterase family protein [Flavobacteriaceae bacterium]
MKNKIISIILILPVLLNFMILESCQFIEKNHQPIKKNLAIENIKKKTQSNILVCAHRSFHRESPENSLESIYKAIEVGIDLVEIDVRTTKDSILVLMHDESIDRTTNGKGLVKDYTYSQLKKFNLKIGDSTTQSKIPLLKEALFISKDKIIPNLDLKAVNYQQLYKMLSEFEMEYKVISYVGKRDKVMKMIGIDSLYAAMPLSKNKKEIEYYFKNTKSPLQHFTDESFTKENMNWMRKKGELVFINTLWDEDEDFIKGNHISMDSVIALKPSIIQTDYPKLLLEYLRTKNLHD